MIRRQCGVPKIQGNYDQEYIADILVEKMFSEIRARNIVQEIMIDLGNVQIEVSQ
jgi:hypothetical protein